ncbi:hypothetical protein T440DRAFT_465071 [Plenodomus tracheiphilus IPT5]|uniref:Uncharacterized protein n=1 Tax=Plenodomus tracheiphilus IPT5 TaxID=1408161 RepID=A0A6A7BF54_9PLEO|nr:hypothetical protein T440DRAFT_465071 [Plenodomus tracheiphilus IPT5]
MPTHSRKSSGASQHRPRRPSHSHQRTSTAPDPPTLLRLPSASSTAASTSPRLRRATLTSPSTPAGTTPASSATTPSYFSPQPAASTTAAGQDPRSPPGARRPPASHSAHGIDNSRGPPVTLVTRGNSDISRRNTQQPSDFAYAQQQLLQAGLVSPGRSQLSTSRKRRESVNLGTGSAMQAPPPPQHQHQQQQTKLPSMSRQNSASTSRPAPQRMASSSDESSESETGPRSRLEDFRAAHSRQGATDNSGTDSEQAEDLFLNIAADSAPRQRSVEAPARIDRLKSRIARVNNRQSLPSAFHSPSPVPSTHSTTPTNRISSAADPRSTESRSVVNGQRRSSLLPTSSRDRQERSPVPAPIITPRTRDPNLSHKASFSSRRDAELSPRDFLAQFGQRRPSNPEAFNTPPSRTPIQAYRPSNLNYSSSRDDTRDRDPRTPHIETTFENASRADGTESHGSTGPAASVWDELDELKTRIRKIELGGKIPSTSGAVVTQAMADRPRTANTSATTVSSSPNQQRKSNISPPESTASTHTPSTNRTHPLLRDALAKARQHISPAVYRVLEATATEALALAEMTGSAGPQGTLHSASSILGGSNVSDRQVRRKADNICRSLTELCIAMADNKTTLASPAMRASAAAMSRRPSVQLNGDSPTIRQSIEPESNTLPGVSPSRALSRIEARRSSMLMSGTNGSYRESSQDLQDERQNPSRLQRAGTSLHRSRGSIDEEDEEETMRAPSRAMTDFRSIRSSEKNRFSSGRQYTSREPMPDLQPSPALQSTAHLRRPTVTGISNENSLLFRDGQRRYDESWKRESSPAYEKQVAGGLRARAQLSANRNPNNRNSIGGISELGRTVSMGRQRLRGNSTGE